MSGFLKVIYNIVRGLCRFPVWLITVTIIQIIYFVTYEPGTKRQITPRKARRIRVLSKFKLFVYNTIPEPIMRFLYRNQTYKNYINTHLKNGLQLRYE